MPGGAPGWPGKAPNPGGRPYGDATGIVSKGGQEAREVRRDDCSPP
jgi:hypothetical protein